MAKAEEIVGEVLVGTLRKMDVGYMIADLKKTFTDEDFKLFADVLKESLGEFLTSVWESDEENVTVETLFLRMKEIVSRRIDES
jgi:hypothetical protein